MTGTWKGYYRYNTEWVREKSGFDRTVFTIEIAEFDGKNFSGTVNDDTNTGGMPETGKITGVINGNSISFQKFMPVHSVIHPELGHLKIPHEKHPTLYYEGKSDDKNKYTGNWKFKIKIGFILGILPVPYRPAKGTWAMEKVQ